MRVSGRGNDTFVFVSYTEVDADWATWVASVLEEAGLTTRIMTWDVPPGGNFVAWMNEMLRNAHWTVAVYSTAYFSSQWCTAEWTSALARETLLPVRIEPIDPPAPLDTVVWTDLFGMGENQARDQILRAVGIRVLPRLATNGFPGAGGRHFPGSAGSGDVAPVPVQPYDIPDALISLGAQLDSPVFRVRLAAINALERLVVGNSDPAALAAVTDLLATYVQGRDWRGSSMSDRVSAIRAIGRTSQGNGVDLAGVNLRGATLTGVTLNHARLTRADMSGAALRRSSLRDCDLSRVDFRDADIAAASLSRSSLRRADLKDARLEGASLKDVDFSGADLTGVRLGGAFWTLGTNWPDGLLASLRDASIEDENEHVFYVEKGFRV